MSYGAVNPASFAGGSSGGWRVTGMTAISGLGLSEVPFVDIRPVLKAPIPDARAADWVLRGTNGHVRYSEREEVTALGARGAALDRPEASCAALIPILKTEGWWLLAQDERRQIMEAESHHISLSIGYLPAISRRLYHCRDLLEPFDFLTWFEFAPAHAPLFDELVARLRDTREWDHVEREVDIRLTRL